jgi:hypothetical protein
MDHIRMDRSRGIQTCIATMIVGYLPLMFLPMALRTPSRR